MVRYRDMNARETDHFLPRTPDVKGIEVGEATLDEYTEARMRQKESLQAQRKKVEDTEGDDSGVITIRSVDEMKRAEQRIQVLRAQIKSNTGPASDNKKPVNQDNFVHQQGFVGIRSETDNVGLLGKIKRIFT